MKLRTTRFGTLDIPDESLITLPHGMVGFPKDTVYAWIPHRNSEDIAWLQSAQNPSVAFPLLNATRVGDGYPELPVSAIAEQAGISFDSIEALALMVVMSVPPHDPPTVNLMAPVVINSLTRLGAQVVLTGSRFQTARLERKIEVTKAEAP